MMVMVIMVEGVVEGVVVEVFVITVKDLVEMHLGCPSFSKAKKLALTHPGYLHHKSGFTEFLIH